MRSDRTVYNPDDVCLFILTLDDLTSQCDTVPVKNEFDSLLGHSLITIVLRYVLIYLKTSLNH